jgi:phosphoserine aminotransferase
MTTLSTDPAPDAAGRLFNFNAGPGVLPLPVLQQAQAELLNYPGAGMSVMEMSHRSKHFEAILHRAEADLRALLNISADCEILFLQGGATLQFAMLPMNLLKPTVSADYVLTGAWAKAAYKEASKLGLARVAGTSEGSNFSHVPDAADLSFDPHAAYVHLTTNETIHGIEWQTDPTPPAGVPLVADMSSDFVSRPVDVARYGLIYAGAQKNLGPAGVTLVIIRRDLLERVPAGLPLMLDYKVQAENKSLYNTPPCWAIYIVGLVLKWLRDLGGLEVVAARNAAKAQVVYDAIDQSGGFYRGHAQAASRSKMNLSFLLPTEDLDALFAKQAEKQGLGGLKGHRSIGGIRASLYNAFPPEGAAVLADFMREFQRTQG